MLRGLETARLIAASDPDKARTVLEALRDPFAGFALDDARVVRALEIATLLGPGVCQDALAPLEPWVPWRADILTFRASCYAATQDPRAARAAEELGRFRAAEPRPLTLSAQPARD
jgi:hypothetical protein